MAQGLEQASELNVMDPEDIGWWIESVDERRYGPVSRATLRRFLEDGYITPDTLVRHCTHAASRPVADQPGMMTGVKIDEDGPVPREHVADAWPRRWRDQVALAEAALPCARHRRPAVAVCIRCHASYCNRCRVKPYRKAFFLCRKCQGSLYNRRVVAYIGDTFVLSMLPYVIALAFVAAVGLPLAVAYAINLVGVIVFMLRDWLFAGAGPGKRLCGLRVVSTKDGKTPLGPGQAVLRWVSLAIPFFNLLDLSVPYRDRYLRRYGDRWAGTRVIDTDGALGRARSRTRYQLARKRVRLSPPPALTMNEFARLG